MIVNANFQNPAKYRLAIFAALATAGFGGAAQAAQLGNIFYIELENHNWTQPAGEGSMNAATGVTSGSGFAQLLNSPASPYLSSLVSTNPAVNPVWGKVSYASAYHSVLSTPTSAGSPPSVHPSEPNYIWQEAGSNFGVTNDNDPYAASSPSVAAIQNYVASHPGTSGQNLSALLQNKGVSWKSYQEDIDLAPSSGTVNQPGASAVTSTVAAQNQWTVPYKSLSGTSASYTNPYNGAHQYDYAAKHNPQVFFPATNGGTAATPDFANSNPSTSNYAPLQQLQSDLNNNATARYNVITPNQFNDMHTALATPFTYAGTTWNAGSDGNRIAVGDNFLSQIVPMIMASQAYQNNGAIVIWTDETEGTNRDTFDHTLAEIVISPLAKGTIDPSGVYNSTLDFTHSSDLAMLQNIFQVPANTLSGYLNDAANPTQDGTRDLSDLFLSGTVPSVVPEPASLGAMAAFATLLIRRRKA